MSQTPLRIAVLVHNDVVRDARVRKEVRTLTEAGHIVDVYGFSKGRDDYPPTVEGARRLVLLEDAAAPQRRRRLARLASRGGFNLILLAGLLAFAWLLHVVPIDDAWVVLLVWFAGVTAQAAIGGPREMLRKARTFLKVARKQIVDKLKKRNLLAWRYRQMATALAYRVPAGSYDVIHAHDMIALIAARRLKSRNDELRLVWDAHELYEHISYAHPGANQFMTRQIRTVTPHIDAFVTISESFSTYYAETHRLPPAKVVMNATRREGAPQDDGRLHQAADLAPNRRILLFQGGLSPHRGIEALLEAAPEMPDEWSLVFMGWGNLQPEVEAVRDTLDAAGRPGAVALVPPAPQEELAAWTAGAALGAIPYRNINLNHLYCTPNKLWEYPNAGVPILATDLEEMGQMIRKWGTGLLLPRDFGGADIVAALDSYDTETEQRLRTNCTRFSEEMSWSRFEPALLEAYDDIA